MATQSKFFADVGIQTSGDTSIGGNLVVTGDLTVNGTNTVIDSTTQSVTDSLIELASGNTTADTVDIGIYGNYNDGLSGEGGASEYTGLFTDATDSTWKLFDGLETEPTSTVNLSGSGYALADLHVGDLVATTLTATNSLTGASINYPTSDGTSGQVLTTNGSGTLTFQSAAGLDGGTLTTTSTSETSMDTFSTTAYRSAKYEVSISDATSGVYQFTELSIVHNGTTASVSQYGTVLTGSSELATFGVDINIGTLRIRVTSASTNSTVYKFKKILVDA